MVYLIVISVPFFPLPNGQAAVESAFGLHLHKLLQSLGPKVARIDVMAPRMSCLTYETSKQSLTVFDANEDRVRFVEAYKGGGGRLKHLIGLPSLAIRLWRAVGESRWVHASGSPLFVPFENLGVLFGWMRNRWTIYVVDIDYRKSASMNMQAGVWSAGVAWRREHIHDARSSLQLRVARAICSVLLLKGEALVRDFGNGEPHVHSFLDAAHGHEMLLGESDLQVKLNRLLTETTLHVCYFGRLVGYKGIDRMLLAIQKAHQAGVGITFDVYGDGDAGPHLAEQTKQLGLDGVVRFHGARPYGLAFLKELDGVDVLLAAPLSEDTPRSAIDAQARGISVLAFDTYYYRDLATNGAGVEVVPWLDVDAMSRRLIALNSDRKTMVELACKSIAFASANTQEEWLRRRASWTPGL